MLVVGLTGGTGAGKTTALRALRDLGAWVFDCDAIYRRLLEDSRELLSAIDDAFPGTVIGGVLDRKKLGAIVFGDSEKLCKLNSITHPAIVGEVRRGLRAAEESGTALAAIDAIALFESGLGDLCRRTYFVTAPREARVGRIMARDGVGREYAEARIDAQRPEGYFLNLSDETLVNDFSHSEEFYIYCLNRFKSLIGGTAMTELEEKKGKLFYKKKHLGDTMTPEERVKSDAYCEKYKDFLGKAKTERLAVKEAVRLAETYGFVPYKSGMELKPGDKVYKNVRGKELLLAVIGKKDPSAGAHICAAHIDSPRLDLKQVPLYESDEVAYFKTHYYGGIRKYQWVAIPLAIHGVVVRADGSEVEVNIGDDPADPALYISDLLPHLGRKQGEQPLNQAITGEQLNVMLGTLPVAGEGADRVKLAVLEILNAKYGITEEDFLSAELEVVPALPVRDVGLDRSLIGAYGHDDRVCAFAELQAIYETEDPEYTAVCILADKEEIGSVGISGMKSESFECFMEDLCDTYGVKLRHCFENSVCISADVTNAFDPTFPEVSERNNNTRLNYGVGMFKYSGHGGKSGANDASAELVGRVRGIFAQNGVVWQTGELGKVDEGGGGTVAGYMADRNIPTVDAGVPVIAMHSPFEVVSKFDCYMTYKAMKAVYAEK